MSEKTPFSKQAAKASWMAPLVAVALGFILKSTTSAPATDGRAVALILGGIAAATVVLGLVLGVVALFGIRKHGWRGILIPSLIGITLTSGWIYLLVSAVMAALRLAPPEG